MPGNWDSNLKRLIGVNPQHFVSWLIKGARVTRELSTHLNRDIDVDVLYEAMLEGHRVLIHIEFQRYRDANMAKRIFEYNAYLTCRFDCTVFSFVIYLKKDGNVVEAPFVRAAPSGKTILYFDFTNIKLWEIPTSELRQLGLIGLLPLLPLTKGGATQETIEDVLMTLLQLEDEPARLNLLSIAFTLASLVLETPTDRSWLKRRFQMFQDLLRDTEIYQIIMHEGFEEGVQQAEQKELQHLRQLLLAFVRPKFPELVSLATKQADDINSTEVLLDLITQVGLSQTADEIVKLVTQAVNKDKN